jgi:hypothetical protein
MMALPLPPTPEPAGSANFLTQLGDPSQYAATLLIVSDHDGGVVVALRTPRSTRLQGVPMRIVPPANCFK